MRIGKIAAIAMVAWLSNTYDTIAGSQPGEGIIFYGASEDAAELFEALQEWYDHYYRIQENMDEHLDALLNGDSRIIGGGLEWHSNGLTRGARILELIRAEIARIENRLIDMGLAQRVLMRESSLEVEAKNQQIAIALEQFGSTSGPQSQIPDVQTEDPGEVESVAVSEATLGVDPKLSDITLSYMDLGMSALSAAAENTAFKIYSSQIDSADLRAHLSDETFLYLYQKGQTDDLRTELQSSMMGTELHKLAVAKALTDVREAVDLYEGIRGIVGVTSDLVELAEILPAAWRGLAGMDGAQLLTLINAISDYSINPVAASERIEDSINAFSRGTAKVLANAIRGSAAEMQATGAILAFLSDAALSRLVREDPSSFMQQHVIYESVLRDASLVTDEDFLSSPVHYPQECVIFCGSSVRPLREALADGVYRLP